MTSGIVAALRERNACSPAMSWVATQEDMSPVALWEACPDGAWMAWALGLLWREHTPAVRQGLRAWALACADRAVRHYAAEALLSAAAAMPLDDQRDALLGHAERLGSLPPQDAADAAWYAADAAWDAAADAARYAADAADAAADAADAAADAARYTAAAADAAWYAADAAWDAAADAARYAADAADAAADAADAAARYAERRSQADDLRRLLPWKHVEPLLKHLVPDAERTGGGV